MKHTISEMLAISGDSESDRLMAANFCNEVVTAARSRLDRVKAIADLRTIVDATQMVVVTDARAGIRHLHAGLHQVMERHLDSVLAGHFDRALEDIAKIQDEATRLHRWFNTLYSDDFALDHACGAPFKRIVPA